MRLWLRGVLCRSVASPRAVNAFGGAGASVVARRPLKRARGAGCWVRSRGLAGADAAAAVARHLLASSSVGARPLLRGGLGAAGCHAVKGQRARRSSRGVLCRVLSAPCAGEALGEGLRVRGRAAPVALRIYLGQAVKWLSAGGSGGGCAASVAVRSRRYVTSKRWGGPADLLDDPHSLQALAASFITRRQVIGQYDRVDNVLVVDPSLKADGV